MTYEVYVLLNLSIVGGRMLEVEYDETVIHRYTEYNSSKIEYFTCTQHI